MVKHARSVAKMATITNAEPENPTIYSPNKFDAIFILGRNIYCFDDREQVIRNCKKWFMENNT